MKKRFVVFILATLIGASAFYAGNYYGESKDMPAMHVEPVKTEIPKVETPKNDPPKVEPVKPIPTPLPQIQTLLASFSTSLNGHSEEGRVSNIKLANSKINGKVLNPGQIFDFNATTGDSNRPEAGWKLAPVIVGKQFVDGYGGGICQVSSTMYNAVKKAGLEIVERHTHSLPVGYVPVGSDATVDYPSLNFRFKNTLDTPVEIKSEIVGDNVVVKLYKIK